MMKATRRSYKLDISKNNKKTVVMGCTHPYWSAVQVGSQHFARQFAKQGWDVHYISAPVTPLHLTGLFNVGSEVARRFKYAFQNPTIHAEGAIHSYIPFSLMAPAGKPMLRDETVTYYWHQTMIPTLSSLRKHIAAREVDLLYIDNLSYHFLLDQLPYSKSIFRVMDIHEGFPGWKGNARKLAVKIAEKTDLVVYSALGLKNYVDSLKPLMSAFVPNGVDFDLFRRTGEGLHRHPLLQHIPDPVVLYIGMINDRVDFRLIRFAAQRLPNVSFVFTGAIEHTKYSSNLPKNIYFTGSVPHKELPWLMRDAVAGMIPFDVNNNMRLIQGIRPLKLLEYMAAGLPVITATWPELIKMDSPAWLYDNEQDFIDLVSRAVGSKYDNSAARNYASQHDWELSYKKMLDFAKFGPHSIDFQILNTHLRRKKS